jgi:hypothetical protein
MSRTGWWADYDAEEPHEYKWQPALQIEGAVLSLATIYFPSEDACREFIRTQVVGQQLLPREE